MTIASRTTEITLSTGGRIAILPTAVKDVVSIYGSILGGPAVFTDARAAAEMTASLLDAGAGSFSKEAFRSALAARGAEIQFDTAGTRLVWSASCFPEDVPFVLARIADALFRPHLAAGEVASEKIRAIADLDDQASNTTVQSDQLLTRLAYPQGHPLRIPLTMEQKKAVGELSAKDLRPIAAQYGTKHLALAIVGDMNVKKTRDAVERSFGKIKAGIARAELSPMTVGSRPGAKRERIFIPDKANTDVSVGAPLGFSIADSRYLPASVVAYMLGGSFTAHLMQTIRERDGLTYSTVARLRAMTDFLEGYFYAWGMFAPQLAARGTEALERETRLFLREGVTDESLESVKEEEAGGYLVSLATTQGLAQHLVRFMQDDKPVSWIDEYPDRVRAVSLKDAQDAAAHLESLPLSIATAGSI